MSYRLVDELQTKAVPVAQTCRLLGASRAGFYEAKHRAATPTFCKASVHLRAAFMSSGQSYGSRRLITAMANSGLQVGRYKVRIRNKSRSTERSKRRRRRTASQQLGGELSHR